MNYEALKSRLPQLAEEGLTYQQMGDVLGVSSAWVHKWMNRMNIKSHYSLNNSLSECKDCGAELDKTILKGNRCMKCRYKDTANRRKDKRKAAVELLGDVCKDCGVSYPHAVYDFHHHTEEKDECVSVMIHSGRKLEDILNEASKCELLCSNCHRMRHFT